MKLSERFSVRHKGHLYRGVVLAVAFGMTALLICLFMLYQNMQYTHEQEEQSVYDNFQVRTNELIKLLKRTGGMHFSLETAAFQTIPFFTTANYDEIAYQIIDTSGMDNPGLGDVNPFLSDGKMHAIVKLLQTLVQSNYDYDTLLLYSPASDFCVGVSQNGLSIHTAHGASEISSALSLSEDDLNDLLERDNAAFIIDNKTLNIHDKLIFSMHLNNGLTAILGVTDYAMDSSILSPGYGSFYMMAGIALMCDGGDGIYWLDQKKWYVRGDEFLGMGDADWSQYPDVFTMDYQDKTYTVMQQSLGMFSLRCVAVFERKDVMIMNTGVFMLFLVISGMWLIIFVASSILFFREWYKPARSIADRISQTIPVESNCIDVYEQISQSIQKLFNTMDLNSAIMSRQEKQLCNSCVLRLIINGVDGVSPEDVERYDIASMADRFAVGIVCPLRQTHWNTQGGDDRETAYYDTVVVLSVQELMQKQLERADVHFYMHHNELILLICLQGLDEAEIKALLAACAIQISTQLQLTVSIHVSGVFSGVESLHLAYRSARISTAITPPEISPLAPNTTQRLTYNRISSEMRMANQIYVADYDGAFQIFRDIVDEIYASEPRPGIRTSLLSGLTGRTYCLIIEADAKNREILDNTLLLAHSVDIVKKEDLLTLWQSAFLFLRGVDSKGREYSPEFKEILSYMQTHFRDENMSLSLLASEFSIGVATVSREFKKNTGVGFLDCLHRMRVAAAKEEIQSTSDPIKDIAIRVGYENALTMTRAFKKYEGVTPSAFRNERQQGASLTGAD
ncbi:MAG: helix-turn-helix domain-containing protein [Clostridia bacterium]|nr:helix-turn-helix domain-containing protein [Clostridia bacterium]